MFRLNYNDLNLQQVESILSNGGAPTSSSAFCSCLTGKTLKVVLDKLPVEGPTLEYEFQSETKLTVKENGGAAISCDYGAKSLKNITLFSHMVTGTKRGYNVIVNWKTSVVTVFEMWFIDYQGEFIDTTKTYLTIMDDKLRNLKPHVNREVQRQYYFGYFEEPGKEPPESRDQVSLRLENCMYLWKEDREKRRLTTYTSLVYSTIVELDTPDGGDVLTFTSDTLQIDESLYIHSFCEVEYSGRLSVEILDLFNSKKIGVTMGIDESDEFEHVLYQGKGKFMGRLTTFFDVSSKGDLPVLNAIGRVDYSVKGARATYRPSIMAKKLTVDEVTEASKDPIIHDAERAGPGMPTTFALPDSDYCVGKNLTFRGDDGYAVELRFKTVRELEYRMAGDSEWHTERYCAMEPDGDLIVLSTYRSGSNPPACFYFALDFKSGCATCISIKLGTKYDLHDPEPTYHFGVIDIEGLTPVRIFRQGFTTDLLGRAFMQTYSDGVCSIHIYNAPHSYSWTITATGASSSRHAMAVWSSPCEYVKLRDDVYIMAWVEQKWSGHMDILCRNLRTGRDVGLGFGISGDGSRISMGKMGAISRPAGSVDLTGVYSLTNCDILS